MAEKEVVVYILNRLEPNLKKKKGRDKPVSFRTAYLESNVILFTKEVKGNFWMISLKYRVWDTENKQKK